MTRTHPITISDIDSFIVIGHAPSVQQLLTGAHLYDDRGYRMKLLNPYTPSNVPRDISDSEPLVHVPFYVEYGTWNGGDFNVEYTLRTHNVSGTYAGEGSTLVMS